MGMTQIGARYISPHGVNVNYARVTVRSAASICDNNITPIGQRPFRGACAYRRGYTLLHFNRSRRRDDAQFCSSSLFPPRSPPLLGVSNISAPSCHLLPTRVFFPIKQGQFPPDYNSEVRSFPLTQTLFLQF